MSQRLTRKEIKQDIREDEVRGVLVRVFEFLQERPYVIVGVVAAFFALVIGVTTLMSYLEGRGDKASEELATALKIASAPIDEEGATPEDAEDPSFASDEAKRSRSKEVFEAVHTGGGSGVASDVAGLYLADIAASEGDNETARGIWESFLADHSDHILALSVRLNLIHLDRENGRAQEVADGLQQELNSAVKTLPEDVILFELAQTLEALDQEDAAIELYQRILDEHPKSPYTAEARRVTTVVSS